MAIQTRARAHARTNAVVGVLAVIVAALIAASALTVFDRLTAGTPVDESVQAALVQIRAGERASLFTDRKSTRLNSSHT